MTTENRKRALAPMESLWGAAAVIAYSFCAIPPIVLAANLIAPLPPAPAALALSFFLPAGFFLFLFLLILVSGFFHRLIPLPEEGEYGLEREGNVRRWMLHAGVVNLLRVPGFMRWIHAIPILRKLYFRLAGAKIHPSVVISYEAVLLDPFLIEIGEGSKIGEWAKIGGHFADRERFEIRRVRIGKNVVIGADSGIFGGVTIGDHALVHARSLVLPGTVINENETWSGAPATRKS